MKIHFVLIVLISLICNACTHAPKQSKKRDLSKKGYVLSIDQDKIEGPRDTVVNGKDYEFAVVPLVLSNFTKDTLKYVNMTCSWDEIFTFNKKSASINGWSCDANFSTVYSIAPRKSYTYRIPVLIEKAAITNNYTFRIGLYLFKYSESGGFGEFDTFLDSKNLASPRPKKMVYKNIIWSNEVTIPK